MMKKRQRIFALIMAFTLVLALLAGCAPQEAPVPAPEPAPEQPAPQPPPPPPPPPPPAPAQPAISGQFLGSVMGFWGEVVAEVTLDEGIITDIYFPDWVEDHRLTPAARDIMASQIIEHQSLGVDSIAGVTASSVALRMAVMDAVVGAGLDGLALMQAPVNISPRPDITIDTDVLVVGGGGAGFSAAIMAAHYCADVVLIEKASVFGGATLVQGGGMGAANPARANLQAITPSQYEELRSIQNMDLDLPELHFDVFPEYRDVLIALQVELAYHFDDRFAGYPVGGGLTVDDGAMPLFDSPNLHLWQMYTGGLRQLLDGTFIAPNIELATILVNSTVDIMQWFTHFVGHPVNYETGPLGTIPGMLWARSHFGFPGVATINAMHEKSLELGATTMLNTRATELIQDNTGRVIGARAVCMIDGTQITFNTANGVILAAGGFGDNPAAVAEWDNYWGGFITPQTLSTKPGTLHGDGIWMAMDVGAAVVDMGVAQLLPFASPVRGTMTDGHWGATASQIWFNRYGERFVNEYAGRDELAKAAFAQGEPGGLFWILTATGNVVPYSTEEVTGGIHRGATVDPEYPPGAAAMYRNFSRGYIWVAQTLAELAEMSRTVPAKGATANFTEAQLRATIERHNQIVRDQYDPDFGKHVISGYLCIDSIESGNYGFFVVSPRIPSIHHTMGGVAINTNAEVLHVDGHVIPGLWAAGENAGGIHGGNRLGGNALADIFTFGRIAGQNAAQSR